MLFEVADEQATPIEVGDREGQPVLRLRRGDPITDHLVGELNDLTGPPGRDDGGAGGRHRPVVVVIVS